MYRGADKTMQYSSSPVHPLRHLGSADSSYTSMAARVMMRDLDCTISSDNRKCKAQHAKVRYGRLVCGASPTCPHRGDAFGIVARLVTLQMAVLQKEIAQS